MKQKIQGLLFITAILFISCSTQPKNAPENIEDCFVVSQLVPENIEWTTIESGFQYFSHKIKALNTTWHVVKIDLKNTSGFLQIRMLPDSKNINPVDFNSFIQENDLIVAVNTTPFSKDNRKYSLMGVQVENSNYISMPQERLSALYLQQNPINSKITAQIISQKQLPLKNDSGCTEYIIGGYFQMIKDGEILEYKNIPHSNTACGISKDERFLYLFTAVPDFSPADINGLYYKECALILQELGCYNAMSFDGGKSTQMYVKGKKEVAPFFKRKVPACLGFSVLQSK